jgi:hypothetical protein
MSTRRRPMVPGVWVALSLLVLGGLGGMVIDRIRFEPQRAAMLAHVEAVIHANQRTPDPWGARRIPSAEAPTDARPDARATPNEWPWTHDGKREPR